MINKLTFSQFLEKYLDKKIIPKNKKILITGSSGFIGSYLVEALANILKKNNNIIYGIDIIRNEKKFKNYKFFKRDLYKLKKGKVPNIKYDYIIHLAGIPSPTYYNKYPLQTMYLNMDLCRIFLEISKKIYNQIQQSSNILFLTHNRPDGDGLSSVCIMIELAEQLNKTYTAYCLDAPSQLFDFLPNIEKFKSIFKIK